MRDDDRSEIDDEENPAPIPFLRRVRAAVERERHSARQWRRLYHLVALDGGPSAFVENLARERAKAAREIEAARKSGDGLGRAAEAQAWAESVGWPLLELLGIKRGGGGALPPWHELPAMIKKKIDATPTSPLASSEVRAFEAEIERLDSRVHELERQIDNERGAVLRALGVRDDGMISAALVEDSAKLARLRVEQGEAWRARALEAEVKLAAFEPAIEFHGRAGTDIVEDVRLPGVCTSECYGDDCHDLCALPSGHEGKHKCVNQLQSEAEEENARKEAAKVIAPVMAEMFKPTFKPTARVLGDQHVVGPPKPCIRAECARERHHVGPCDDGKTIGVDCFTDLESTVPVVAVTKAFKRAMTRKDELAGALAVVCPICNAAPGSPCADMRLPDRPVRKSAPHGERFAAARSAGLVGNVVHVERKEG